MGILRRRKNRRDDARVVRFGADFGLTKDTIFNACKSVIPTEYDEQVCGFISNLVCYILPQMEGCGGTPPPACSEINQPCGTGCCAGLTCDPVEGVCKLPQ